MARRYADRAPHQFLRCPSAIISWRNTEWRALGRVSSSVANFSKWVRMYKTLFAMLSAVLSDMRLCPCPM